MLNFQIEQLRRFPQRPDETWQGGLVRSHSWITGEGPKPYRPWLALWVAVEADMIGPPIVCPPDEVDFTRAVDALLKFANAPEVGGYRPGRVEVCDSALADHLRGLLGRMGIAVECRDRLPEFERLVAALDREVGGRPPIPDALSGQGVTQERLRAFADAAKAFYEAAPWDHLTDEDLIQIESPEPPAGMQFTTVLGAAGRAFGLGLHESPEACWAIRREDDPARWFASCKGGAWSLTFGGITELPLGDADLWEEHHLPLAGDRAYPCAMHYSPGGEVVRPDVTALAFLEGLLRALASTTEDEIDSGRWRVAVETSAGPAQFILAVPDLLDPPAWEDLVKRGFTPDRRAMERMHAQMQRFIADKNFRNIEEINRAISREFVGKSPDPSRFPPRNALEQAQDLCYQAFENVGRRRLQLTRQALATCADCADAYVLLAERTNDSSRAAELYAQGVQAGERALGPKPFKEEAGRFWGMVDTRPYMRARLGLGTTLEQMGRLEEAADHYRELLRLNAQDNQGVRYLYLPLLLRLGRDAEAARFMKDSQDEPTANWTYTRALLAYRLGGDCASARTELKKALKVNPHVPDHLLADEEPDLLPESYGLGTREEAAICAAELRSAFAVTPGAMRWLEAQAERLREDPPSSVAVPKRRDRQVRRKRRSQERKRKRR